MTRKQLIEENTIAFAKYDYRQHFILDGAPDEAIDNWIKEKPRSFWLWWWSPNEDD